jgi:hypothetical protein
VCLGRARPSGEELKGPFFLVDDSMFEPLVEMLESDSIL